MAAIICAVALEERDLLRVGIAACALPLLAIAVTALRRTQVTAVHQVMPGRLQPGGFGRALLHLTNTGTARTAALDVSEAGVPGLTAGMRYLIAPIRAGGTATIGYPIAAAARGRYRLGPPWLRRSDPFGLWEDHRSLPVETEILVVPVVLPLTGIPTSGGSRSAASGRALVGTTGGDPDVGVRPYRSGDDTRTIHWRASARYDELVVRLQEPVSHGGSTVLVDHRAGAHRGDGPESSLEPAVVLAASVSLHLLAADRQVRLVSHRNTVIAEGNDIADDVLAGLAVLEPDDDQHLGPLDPVGGGLLVAVLGEMSERDVAALLAARPRAGNAVAIVLDVRSWADGSRSEPRSQPEQQLRARLQTPSQQQDPVAARTLRAAGWAVAVVRNGEDLALAWQQLCVANAPGSRIPAGVAGGLAENPTPSWAAS